MLIIIKILILFIIRDTYNRRNYCFISSSLSLTISLFHHHQDYFTASHIHKMHKI